MKQYLFLFIGLIAVLPIQAAWAVDLDLVVPLEELSNYLPDRKRHLEWENDDPDPLRIDFNRSKEKGFISEEEKGCINTLKNVLRERGISGIVFGRGAVSSKILIGGYVFSPADELGFANDQGDWTPVCPGRVVILLEVTKGKGVFLISGKDESENKFEIVWEDFLRF
ncbi:hypothetical protein AYO37_00835 [Opitutia bacterium SCGC AG-212-L18]|nr:hypothetical protein AYO37_00835 [Opitutae bacterium SCGC AG-212-L18]